MSAALVVAALVSGCSSSSNNNDGSTAYTPPPPATTYTADLATPECLVLLACTQSLCSNAFCFCQDANSLSNCQATCRGYTKGLTTGCASCLSGLFATSLTCPDFTKLPAPYDQCASSCP